MVHERVLLGVGGLCVLAVVVVRSPVCCACVPEVLTGTFPAVGVVTLVALGVTAAYAAPSFCGAAEAFCGGEFRFVAVRTV